MEEPRCFRVLITPRALRMLKKIRKRYGRQTFEVLRDLILDLEIDPDKKGVALRPPLNGLYSLYYSRFRVVYSVDQGELRVIALAAGHHASGDRNDIYAIVERLVERGAIDADRLELDDEDDA